MSKLEDAEKHKMFSSMFYPAFFVALLWIIEIVENTFHLDLTGLGIYPRELFGLKGIFLSVLIHSDFSHLINNSIPLLILGTCLFYFYRSLAFRAILISWFAAGLYTWISARSSYHIGASGLVYSLFGFLLFSGFLRKNPSLIGISFLVAFLYGSMVWGILPWDYKISWEGHLWGLFIGVVLAIYYRRKGPPKKKYSWDYEEEGEDEDEESPQLPANDQHSPNQSSTSDIAYRYSFKEKKEGES